MKLKNITTSFFLLLGFTLLFSCGINSSSKAQIGDQFDTRRSPDKSLPIAYFAGGCFWCTEACFERINGVQAVISGYSGGEAKTATYKLVSAAKTKHAEAIAISYDPKVISYRTLLNVFFVAHDPTTLNRQGPDRGEQYRSAIFYKSQEELAIAKSVIDSIQKIKLYSDPVVTQLEPFKAFYSAEAYHQGYYELHPENPYVISVTRPKVKKIEKIFKDILKPQVLIKP